LGKLKNSFDFSKAALLSNKSYAFTTQKRLFYEVKAYVLQGKNYPFFYLYSSI